MYMFVEVTTRLLEGSPLLWSDFRHITSFLIQINLYITRSDICASYVDWLKTFGNLLEGVPLHVLNAKWSSHPCFSPDVHSHRGSANARFSCLVRSE